MCVNIPKHMYMIYYFLIVHQNFSGAANTDALILAIHVASSFFPQLLSLNLALCWSLAFPFSLSESPLLGHHSSSDAARWKYYPLSQACACGSLIVTLITLHCPQSSSDVHVLTRVLCMLPGMNARSPPVWAVKWSSLYSHHALGLFLLACIRLHLDHSVCWGWL